METAEFLFRARLDAPSLEAWVEAGWLVRRGEGFGELDLARACLIRELREELGVNDEGVTVVLGLLDQVHGMRLALRRAVLTLRTLPEPLRAEALTALHEAEDAAAGAAARRAGPAPGS